MNWRSILFVSMIITSCGSTQSDAISFNEKDYELESSAKGDNNKKIGETYVNKYDSRFTMRKLFDNNEKVQAVSFYYDKKMIGPARAYDETGNMKYEVLSFKNFDTTGYIYDKEKQALIKVAKK